VRRVEGKATNYLEEPATESRIPVSRALTATSEKDHRGALPARACQDRLKTSPAGNRSDICLSEYSDPRSARGAASAHAGHAAAPVELKETTMSSLSAINIPGSRICGREPRPG